MLPHSISTFISILIVSAAIVIVIGGKAPDVNRVLTFPFHCLRAMTAFLIFRKGIVWTALVWISTLATVIDLWVVFRGTHWWAVTQTMILFTTPPAIGWTLRHLYRRRQARRFQLPQRKR